MLTVKLYVSFVTDMIAAVVNKNEGAPEMVSAILDELGDGDMDIIGDFYFRPPSDRK